MEVKKVKISDLKLDKRNARTHSDKNLSAIKASLEKFGQLKNIVIDSAGNVVAGNGTVTAAKQLGWTEINAHVTDLKGADLVAFALADNRTAELAEWDTDIKAELLAELELADFDIASIGFDTDDLGGKGTDGLTDPDAVPEVPEVPTAKLGDIWQLGNHRLMCGDSTDAGMIKALMGGNTADLWLTDPPYNVAYEGKTSDALKIQNDKMGDETFVDFIKKSCNAAKNVLKDGGAFYVWHANNTSRLFQDAIREAGLQVRQHLVWLKSSIVMGQQDYHYKHEPCLYGWKDGAAHFWGNDRKQTTILEFGKPSRNGVHPTMKPVDLFEYQVCNNTKINGIVLDSFGGSGTTIMAAEKSQRRAFLMEIDPIYCDVIVKRWEDFTGKKAELLA